MSYEIAVNFPALSEAEQILISLKNDIDGYQSQMAQVTRPLVAVWVESGSEAGAAYQTKTNEIDRAEENMIGIAQMFAGAVNNGNTTQQLGEKRIGESFV
ncbi:MAG: WXG100 family type VII secretion target [Phycicoccus sp.]